MVKKIIQYALIIFLIPVSLLAQKEGEKKYIQVQKKGLKKLDTVLGEFKVFKGEILERNKELQTLLPNGKKITLGKRDDMKTYPNPQILLNGLLKQTIKKQKVLLGNEKIEEGYLFDFSSLKGLESKDTIRIANYKDVLLSLNKGSEKTKKVYPYDSSRLVCFYKKTKNLSDPYIRIIIPGYVTAYVDKKAIEEDKELKYDKEKFQEYTLIIDSKLETVLYNPIIGKAYKFNKNDVKIVELPEGTYKINGKEEELVYTENKFQIKPITTFDEKFYIWGGAIVLFLGIIFLILRFYGKKIFIRKPIKEVNKNDWGDEDISTEGTINTRQSKSNSIASKDLKKLSNEVIKAIKESRDKTITEINKLQYQIKDSGNEELASLKDRNELLTSEKDQLVASKKELNHAVEENKTQLKSLEKELKKYLAQSLFLQDYNISIHKFIGFFKSIKEIETKLIFNINTQIHYTVKQFQATVFAKYLDSKITAGFEKWNTILKTIVNNEGLITDKNLIHQIGGKASSKEKLEGIERIVINDVLIYKVDRLLILLEELRNTTTITGVNIEVSTDMIEKSKMDIISDMRTLFGVEIENVKLFSNFDAYSKIKPVQESMSYEIYNKALSMGTIKEIKTYGMRSKEKLIETIVIEE